MKQIRVNRNIKLRISDATVMLDTEAVRELGDVASSNRVAVLDGALSVENYLAKIISHFFFPKTSDKKEAFDAMVINSDSFPFSAKRKLVQYIVNKENLLEGSAKQKFDEDLRKAMSLRNAFAHGHLCSDGKAVWLCYFEGAPREQELTDSYLTDIQAQLNSTCTVCLELAKKIGAISVG